MISRSMLSLANISRHHMIHAVSRKNQQNFTRTLLTSQPLRNTKRIDDKEIWIEDNLLLDIKESAAETTVDVVPRKSGREDKLLPAAKVQSTSCVLCRLNLHKLHYTDVMILSQFIKKNGSTLTYHESKLCSKQYRNVIKLIGQAQRCNLIQRPPDYLVPGPWHDLNTYIEPDRRRDQPMKVIKKEYWKI